MKIGGNITAKIQKLSPTKNDIGEIVKTWIDETEITGWLDLQSGSANSAGYTQFNAKIQESTHVFVCDYVALNVTPENSRMVIDGKTYDVKLIDDPMEMHYQLEIYLKFTGGQ